jgi:SAM-dependent methyltransferase
MKHADDVPTAVDFHDPEHALEWTRTTPLERPWRPRFFAAFADALAPVASPRILELGSGPGHLAHAVLSRIATRSYVALDFSAAMHALAREHLGALADRVTFVQRDFRDPAWTADLGAFDAVLTLQAAHETRHKRHVAPLLAQARSVLVPGGRMLYCDSYESATSKPQLFLPRDEQPRALEQAGFSAVQCLHDESGMALYAATA